jgi:hypothetical protein
MLTHDDDSVWPGSRVPSPLNFLPFDILQTRRKNQVSMNGFPNSTDSDHDPQQGHKNGEYLKIEEA